MADVHTAEIRLGMINYPLVNSHSRLEYHHFQFRKYIFNPGPCSIAMLDYRSVTLPQPISTNHGAAMPQRSQLKPKQGWKASGDRKDNVGLGIFLGPENWIYKYE